MAEILYEICPQHPETHLFHVRCTIPTPNLLGQIVQFPAWIPGSYLIRDFAKYLLTIKASCNNKPVNLRMLDKTTWQVEPKTELEMNPLVIEYQVYSLDLTPRGAYLDDKQGFFNGSRVFIQVLGAEEMPCWVDILPPHDPNYQAWQLATTFPAVETDPRGFGRYSASNYDALLDFPVQMGIFTRLPFNPLEIPHELIITGRHWGDLDRVLRDLKILCEHHLTFFGQPYPIDRYQFLLNLFKGGYGGLEHSYASCLLLSPYNFPLARDADIMTEGYRTLLGLFSHEYFHLWNVKRLRPKAFTPYQLKIENYTRLLWIFEGITSYYDELALLRCGLISLNSYLELLSRLITRIHETPGRHQQTLEQSSMEAWTKFYQANENSLNSTISYYTKGAYVAFALDMTIRSKSAGTLSLDDVMQAFWRKFGQKEIPIPENGFEAIASEVVGFDLQPFFDKALRSTEELSIETLLSVVGLELNWQCKFSVEELGGMTSAYTSEFLENRPLLEVKLKPGVPHAEVAAVWADSAAEAAGISVYDTIIAVDYIRVDRATLEPTIGNYKPGDWVTLHIFRREELMELKVCLRAGWLKNCHLRAVDEPSSAQAEALKQWIKPSWIHKDLL